MLHEVDVLVWGTGFAATDFLAPMTITLAYPGANEDAALTGAAPSCVRP